jgi:hypothetical protein
MPLDLPPAYSSPLLVTSTTALCSALAGESGSSGAAHELPPPAAAA